MPKQINGLFWSLEELAAELGVNPSVLFRMHKEDERVPRFNKRTMLFPDSIAQLHFADKKYPKYTLITAAKICNMSPDKFTRIIDAGFPTFLNKDSKICVLQEHIPLFKKAYTNALARMIKDRSLKLEATVSEEAIKLLLK